MSSLHCVDCGRFVPMEWGRRWPGADLVCTACIEAGSWVDDDLTKDEEEE